MQRFSVAVLGVVFTLLNLDCMAQVTDTRQGAIESAFRSLQVRVGDERVSSVPVIPLNGGRQIVVSFDELSEEARYLRYSLVHCDARWQPEGLVESEFLDGFNEGKVEDFAYSRATTVHYVNYTIRVPNDEMKITEPGNYLLRVYDENDPEATLVQARFSVCDFSAGVNASVSSRTDIDTNVAHQQLTMMVDPKNVRYDDPFSEFTVVVTPNGRNDSERYFTSPQRLDGKKIVYAHLRDLIFPAGNEYRRFETVEDNVAGMHVSHIERKAPAINIFLETDLPRSNEPYLYDRTQAGRFLIRAAGVSDSDTEADYIMTHFTLKTPEKRNGDIFLEGDFTDRRYEPASRMVYNHATGRYEQSLLLKQGSYNYQYVFVPSGSMTGDASAIEGNRYQTNNEYVIKVYHRPRGTRFDRLVGVSTLTSGI